MSLLRSFFGLRTIYFKQTPAEIVYFYLCVAVFGWVILPAIQSGFRPLHYAYAPLILIIAYALLRTAIRTIVVNRYLRQYPESLLVIPPAELNNSSINLELDEVDKLKPIAAYKNARVFLATFNFYTHTKYGKFLAKEVYYNVLEVQLGRRLPHIVFDSRVAKGSQFKSLYLKAQRISIQGSFDDVFDTYVPQTYAIDSLSFITPEVMEAMMEAKDYDIEIVNDKLLLYAPLLGNEDIDAFLAKGRAIAAELNDNINTYRDDRLTGEDRKTNVTLFARSLLRSPMKSLIKAWLLGLATIAIVVSSFFVNPDTRELMLFNGFSILVYVLFLCYAWQAFTIIRENRKSLEAYRILYHTKRGKPIKNSIA